MTTKKIDYTQAEIQAHTIQKWSCAAFWCDDLDGSDNRVATFDKYIDEAFKRLAASLGYRVERIEAPAVTEAA